MTQSNGWWNDDLGYVRWVGARFSDPRTYDDFRDLIDNADDSLGNKEVRGLLIQVLKQNDPILLNKVVNYLAKEFKHLFGKKTINVVVKLLQDRDFDKKKNDNLEESEEALLTIPFNNSTIEIRKDGIYEVKNYERKIDYILTLDGDVKVLFKVNDKKLNIDRFTFSINNKTFHTLSLMEIVRLLEDKTYGGTHGKDIIKRVFNYLTDKIEERKPEYIIGFNDGWKLPINEREKKYALIQYTDIDKDVYERTKLIIKQYSEKEKEKIRKTLKEFIERTQTQPLKLATIIGWSLSAVFRMSIMDFFEIFPHLYNFGERTAGKGSLEKFWIVHLYKIFEKLLPSKTLESSSRLEDYLASGTFPICITEAEGRYIRNTIPILKEHPTDNTDFERKKNAKELLFRKPKCAGLTIDSNYIIEEFKDAALNSKVILNEFTKEDIPKRDYTWKRLYRELKKKKLFSFIYAATKDWDHETLIRIFELNIEETEKNFIDHEDIERKNPRIIAIYCILKFGLYIFHHSFGFSLESILKIKNEDLLGYLIKERRVIPSNLIGKFYSFCLIALDYDEGGEDDRGHFYRGDNPKFLTSKLEMHKDDFHFAFSQKNLRDFNEFIAGSTYSRPYSLTGLFNVLQDGFSNKDNITLSNIIAFKGKKKTNYILITKDWFKEKAL